MWSYFATPIGELLGRGDESGLWVLSDNPDFWIAFWAPMEVVRSIRSNEAKWMNLFCGSLVRRLHPEKRFACQNYPERVVWMSGDATLDTVAVISWAGRKYFVFDAPPLVAPFKRHDVEEVIIGECELLATLIMTLLWGIKDSASRILIICTDNLNLFEWLKLWKAKTGCANRMLQALIDYLIEHGIEIVPRYVRSGHSFSCDFLSRADANGIKEWSVRMEMTQRQLPKQWKQFCNKWKPVKNCEGPKPISSESTLRSYSKHVSGCEWRHA